MPNEALDSNPGQEPGKPDAPAKDSHLGTWGRRALIVWSLIGAAILVYFLGIALNVLAIPVGIVVWTVVIVFCLRGTVEALQHRGVHRGLATVAAYILMVAVVAAVGGLMFSPMFGVGDQFVSLAESAPGYVERLSSYANDLYTRYPDILENPQVLEWVAQAQSSFSDWMQTLAASSVGGLIDVGTVTLNTLMCIGFALVVAFWILLELPGLARETHRLIGNKYADDLHFFHITFTRVLGGYIKGTLLQCGIIAIGCMITFSVLGIPNSIALGIITGMLNVIPVIGPWLGGAAAAIPGFLQSPIIAVAALIVTIAIQQVVYTFISPKIMSNSVDVHPALVIIAMMMGYAIGGTMSGLVGSLVGMLLSIPMVAVGKAAFVYYFEKRTNRHLVAVDGVLFKGVPSSPDAPNPAHDATAPHPGAQLARERAAQRQAARKAAGAYPTPRLRKRGGDKHQASADVAADTADAPEQPDAAGHDSVRHKA